MSNGKDKLDQFLAQHKRNREIERRMDSCNKGDLGRYFAYSLLALAVIWFVYRLFS